MPDAWKVAATVDGLRPILPMAAVQNQSTSSMHLLTNASSRCAETFKYLIKGNANTEIKHFYELPFFLVLE